MTLNQIRALAALVMATLVLAGSQIAVQILPQRHDPAAIPAVQFDETSYIKGRGDSDPAPDPDPTEDPDSYIKG